MEVVAMSRVFHTPLGREPCDLFFSWGRLACSGGCRKGMEVVGMSEGEEEEEEEAYVVCGQGGRLKTLKSPCFFCLCLCKQDASIFRCAAGERSVGSVTRGG